MTQRADNGSTGTKGSGSSSGYRATMVVCAAGGLAYLGIEIAKGEPGLGIALLAIMAAYALILTLFRRRSEAIGLLAGDATDERHAAISLQALAFTAMVLVSAILIGFMVSLATDSEYAKVFSALAGLGGLSFGGALAYLSRRG